MMSHYGLDESTTAQIINILKKYPEIVQVILYGSRAMHTHHSGSDIDLCITESISQNILFQLRNDFDESSLPYKFDITTYSQIDNESLKDHIHRVGKVFYTKNRDIER